MHEIVAQAAIGARSSPSKWVRLRLRELLGIHTNMPGVLPDDINNAAFSGAGAIGPQPTRNCLRAFAVRISKRVFGYASSAGVAAADNVRNRRFTRRPGGLFPGSRRAQL